MSDRTKAARRFCRDLVNNRCSAESELIPLINMKNKLLLNRILIGRKLISPMRSAGLLSIVVLSILNTSVANAKHKKLNDSAYTTNEVTALSGKVTSKLTGEALIGVSIKVKGSTSGTSTNQDGNFTISVPENSTLIVSYVGFETIEVPVNNQSSINISLQPSTSKLDEVVVIGYGSSKRSDVTGALSSVSTKDIKSLPIARVDQAIQGRAAGVVVQNNTAAPNGQVSIRIRGSNSIQGTNDPLVVIDGFIGGDLGSVNPNDVSSIEVLKDASSTAIYGSRGANGVILIATKKGNNGKTTVQYNSFLNFTSVRRKLDLLNAGQYAEAVNANRTDLGIAAPFTAAEVTNFKSNGGTDWQNQIFRDALQQSHQVSVSGGGQNTSYYLSGNVINNDGIIKNTNFRQYALRTNIDSRLSDHFKIGLNLNLSRSADHPTALNGFANGSPVFAASLWAPTLNAYNADGAYTLPATAYGPRTVFNPLAYALEPISDNIRERTEINPFVEYMIIKGLTAKVSGGARFVNDQNSYYNNTRPQGGVGNAAAGISNPRYMVLQNTNQLNYQKAFTGGHDLNVVAVFEQQFEQYSSSFAGSTGFLTDGLTYNSLGLGANPLVPFSTKNTKNILSYIGRINYGYKEKYLMSLSGRYDGASVFGANNPYAFFPSASVAWRVNKEDFMKSFDKLSNLKIRASYGVTGSQAIPPYSALSQLNTDGSAYAINGSSLSTGVGLGSLGDPNLKWESTAQFNTGIDLGFFNDRLQFTADYYRKKTSDLLLNVPNALTSGYGTILKNVGAIENKGIELNLQGNPIAGNFNWNTNLNFGINRNKVLALSEGVNEISLGGPGLPNFGNTIFLEVGQPLGVLKGYIQNGIWGTAEAAEATKFGTIPGAPKYIDQNLDGVIDSKDITRMGNTFPKFTYGWNNTFSFKNLDLNVFLQGSDGNKIYNLSRVRNERSSSDADATSARILNRWTEQNQNTDVPSFKGSNQYEQLQSSRWMEDGSYLRIKNITLGYTFPKALLGRAKVSGLRLYATGFNLFTFTKYTGYDPEASTGVDSRGGIDLATYPSQKSVTVGLNVSL